MIDLESKAQEIIADVAKSLVGGGDPVAVVAAHLAVVHSDGVLVGSEATGAAISGALEAVAEATG
jgi:hypothetical protein